MSVLPNRNCGVSNHKTSPTIDGASLPGLDDLAHGASASCNFQGEHFCQPYHLGPGSVEIAVMEKKSTVATACPCRRANGVDCVYIEFLSTGEPCRDPVAALLNEQARSKGLSRSQQAVMQCI